MAFNYYNNKKPQINNDRYLKYFTIIITSIVTTSLLLLLFLVVKPYLDEKNAINQDIVGFKKDILAQESYRAHQGEAQVSDRVVARFKGKVDDVYIDNLSIEKEVFIIGSNNYIPGFEEGFINHKAGDSFTITTSFPLDDSFGELAGKEVIFEVFLIEVLRFDNTIKMDDDFVKVLASRYKEFSGLENVQDLDTFLAKQYKLTRKKG
ncbi:MAG: FKBP-type peptidyl-prolyl cis-trans isomerase [Bacilli bacterium]